MTAQRFGEGPSPARVMLVGDFLSPNGQIISGTAGDELGKMLHEAGILRSECYCTNVVNLFEPPNAVAEAKKDITQKHVPYRDRFVLPCVLDGVERLHREIELVKPNVIVTLGNLPLWVLTGAWGILKWRGSQLQTTSLYRPNPSPDDPEGLLKPAPYKVIPVVHPSMVMRQWEFRAAAVNDLKRVAKERATILYANKPDWRFTVRPSFEAALSTLQRLLEALDNPAHPWDRWLDFDYETRAGHIACAGISWSKEDALCIPFMCVENKEGYWTLEEEAVLVWTLYRLLTHPNVKVRGQNLLYDSQYSFRHWHFVPRVVQDTMISWHTLFAGLPKRLDYQASILCDHYVYWKDDGKTWHKDMSEDNLWSYNCEDCVRTREVGEHEAASIEKLGLQEVEKYQQALFWPVLKAMQRGVRIDKQARAAFAMELQEEIVKREEFFVQVLGHPLNPNSHTQMQKLFYGDLGVQPVMSKAKKGMPAHVTCDDKALELIKVREPLARPLIKAIQEYRSLGVFLSTFVSAPLDEDDRMRCSYNICGTETYRFNSSKNAFDSGTNLQNVPKGGEEDGLILPNVRKLFIPDPGMTFFDMDLDRADLQVVAWEAGDSILKEALKRGVDMHILNAYAIMGLEPPDLDWLVESHAEYPAIRARMKKARQLAKSWCHGTNYGGKARTMAAAAGITVIESERAQNRYFGRYPGILEWHKRTEQTLRTTRCVTNKFGYRRYYFDRVESLLPEALAWIPQSTVAIYIDRIWLRIFQNIPQVEILLQVHDSLVGQFPTYLKAPLIREIQEQSRQVIIPYEDPLIIPVGIKTSEKSWGDC